MMNHELRAELANAKLMLDRKDIEIAELREELGQCSRELMACSATLDEKRRQLLELTSGYEQGVAWASGKRDAVPMMGASEMQAMGIVSTPFPMPAPEPGVSYGDPSNVGDEDLPEPGVELAEWNKLDVGDDTSDLPEEEPNLNTPEGDSDFEVTP